MCQLKNELVAALRLRLSKFLLAPFVVAYMVPAFGAEPLRAEVLKSSVNASVPAAQAQPAFCCSAVIVSPDGKTVAVSETADDSLAIVDTASMSQTAMIPVRQPADLVFNQGGQLYVTYSKNETGWADTVAHVDATTGAIKNPITIGSIVVGAAVSADGRLLFTGLEPYAGKPGCSCLIMVIDTQNDRIQREVKVPFGLFNLSPERHRDEVLAATGEGFWGVTADGKHRAFGKLPSGDYDQTEVSLDGNYLLSRNRFDVSVVNLKSHNLELRSPVSDDRERRWAGKGISLSPFTPIVYVVNGNGITALNWRNGAHLADIPLGQIPPDTIALSPDGQELYAVDSGTLFRINALTFKVEGQCPLWVRNHQP